MNLSSSGVAEVKIGADEVPGMLALRAAVVGISEKGGGSGTRPALRAAMTLCRGESSAQGMDDNVGLSRTAKAWLMWAGEEGG